MPARRRQNFQKDVKDAALDRADGCCEHQDDSGERCPCVLQPGYYQFVHVIADRIGGRPTLANCRVWCTPCHRGEFPRDMAVIAKVRRQEAKHVVGLTCSRRPMPGGTTDYRTKGFDGLVRDRDTGAVLSRPWAIDLGSL